METLKIRVLRPEPPTKVTREEKRAQYLAGLAYLGTLRGAAEVAGVSYREVYEWRREVPGFAEEEAIAMEGFADVLEKAAIARALKKSDLLMMFLLKGLRPNKYRENRVVEVSGPGGRPIEHVHAIRQLSDSDLERRLATLEARERGAPALTGGETPAQVVDIPPHVG